MILLVCGCVNVWVIEMKHNQLPERSSGMLVVRSPTFERSKDSHCVSPDTGFLPSWNKLQALCALKNRCLGYIHHAFAEEITEQSPSKISDLKTFHLCKADFSISATKEKTILKSPLVKLWDKHLTLVKGQFVWFLWMNVLKVSRSFCFPERS